MFRNLFKYILCFVILIYAVYLHDCKDGWKSFADSCYHLSLDKRDWSSSKMYCESEGSVLVQADTTEEIDFLMTMLSDQLMLGSFDNANIWIGTWNNTTIGNFTWVDGSTVKERRHASENIDGCPSLINGNEKDQWLAETAECSRQFFHICETNKTVSRSGLVKPLTKNDSSTQSHCNEGWFAFKDSRYLLSRVPRTWYSSKIHCETIGTRLVTIGTYREKISKEYENMPLFFQDVCEKNFWIGSPNVYNPETRSVMSSSAFDPDIPANESQCIILNKGWAITDCKDKYPSICEKNETQKYLGGEELLNFSLPIDQVSRNCEYLQKDKKKEYVKSNVSFEDLYDKVFNSSDYDPVNVLKQLKNATYAYKANNETLPSDRLTNVVKMMSKLAESMDLNNSKALTEDSLKPYLEIMNNLLGDHTFYSWIDIINQTGKGANKVIDGFKSIMNAEDESAKNAFARECEYRPTDKQKERLKTNVSIDALYDQFINSSDYDKVYVLNQLKNATTVFKENNETVPSERIIMILKMITKLAGGVDLNDPKSLTDESLKPYLEIVSNLLGDHTKESWIVIINQTGSGANELLDGVEKFMTNINETDIVESVNNTYVVKASLRDCENGIHFPNHTDMALPAWLAKTKNKIFLNCDKDSNSYVGIIFNSIESTFPSTYGPEMLVSLHTIYLQMFF
ncbi:uncharacterized protein LOC132719485 [Ruditapes philippinarum]|uniref:uncharacterized protein LOC132719485 n=1 Tax=Ruditapes philippinarum TaxID=129788 RepID=UPI00295B5D17|nr:uncharacterized protein LOC132719485 [Ruditapes philippinarum]